MTPYYNPMEMPFSQQRTEQEECSGLTCINEEENGSQGGAGWLSGAGDALGGLADVLGVFYGTNPPQNPPANQQNVSGSPMPRQNNSGLIIAIAIVLLLLVVVGVVLAVRASRKK
jgi:hypothetical protein